MQTRSESDEVRLTFYVKDPDSNTEDLCETFYWDGSGWVVQGKRCGARVSAQLVALADDEVPNRVSDRTVDAFVRKLVKERYGVDLPPAPAGTAHLYTPPAEAGVA